MYEDKHRASALDSSPQSICDHDEYEILIEIGSDLWSGTDDEVQVRFYFLDGSVTEWFNLNQPMFNDFERFSTNYFCVKAQQGKRLQNPAFIGIRKFGHDRMKIEGIAVWTKMSSSLFDVGQWIRSDNEYRFGSRTICKDQRCILVI